MLTTQEVEQYIRLTLKQYGLTGYRITWKETYKRTFGRANPWEKEIILSKEILRSFHLFNWILKHEIAHCIHWMRNGGSFKNKNGNNVFHGKEFKAICREIGISGSTKIPV